MTSSQRITAQRPITDKSFEALRPLNEARQKFGKDGIYVRRPLYVTVVTSHESRPSEDPLDNDHSNSLAAVFYPIVESAPEPLDLKVEGVAYFDKYRRVSMKTLALILEDPEGVLFSERKEYFKRMGKPLPDEPFIPHVNIFHVNIPKATEEMKSWVQDRMPARLSLGTLASYPPTIDRSSRLTANTLLTSINHSAPITHVPSVDQLTIPQDIFAKMISRKPIEGQE